MAKIKFLFFTVTVLLLLQLFYGCNATKDIAKEEKKIPQYWTNEDSQTTVDSLVNELLNKNWVVKKSGKRVKVVVGKVLNRTNEKINTELIEKNIERSLLNSGKVSFITPKEKLEKVRTNRKQSTDFTGSKKFGKYLKSLKTDFFIEGDLSLTTDTLKKPIVKKYTLSLTVINAKKNKEAASGEISVIK